MVDDDNDDDDDEFITSEWSIYEWRELLLLH